MGEFNHENDQVEQEAAEQVRVPPEEQNWLKRHKLSLHLRETQQMSLNDSMPLLCEESIHPNSI
jgi:hypothetical protein